MAGDVSPDDIVYIGSSFSRGDFIKWAGLMGLGALLAACNPKATGLSPIEAQATAQANLPENQRIERFFPPELLRGLGWMRIEPLADAVGVEQRAVGSGLVYYETETQLGFLTAQHVGQGIFWETLILNFPYSTGTNRIWVDARAGAPKGRNPTNDEWWISDDGSGLPIRAIVIQKPEGFTEYVTDPSFRPKVSTETPKKGEEYYLGGYPIATNLNPVFSTLTFQGFGNISGADIPLYEFKGPAGDVMSGGPIIDKAGAVVALLSRGSSIGSKSMAWGIPFKDHLPKLAF